MDNKIRAILQYEVDQDGLRLSLVKQRIDGSYYFQAFTFNKIHIPARYHQDIEIMLATALNGLGIPTVEDAEG